MDIQKLREVNPAAAAQYVKKQKQRARVAEMMRPYENAQRMNIERAKAQAEKNQAYTEEKRLREMEEQETDKRNAELVMREFQEAGEIAAERGW